GVRLSQGDRAEGDRALALEDRVKGDAIVDRLPQPARGAGHVHDAGPLLMDGKIDDPAAHVGRPDRARFQSLQELRNQRCGFLPATWQKKTEDDGETNCQALHVRALPPAWWNSLKLKVYGQEGKTARRIEANHETHETHEKQTAK